jgi:hypothetical protein
MMHRALSTVGKMVLRKLFFVFGRSAAAALL